MAHELADDFPVEGVDYVHFAVGNARQAAHYYSTAFGMTVTAYRGPETGSRDVSSYVLEAGAARVVFSAPGHAGTDLGRPVAAHGGGVVGGALRVPGAAPAHQLAIQRGAPGTMGAPNEKEEVRKGGGA